MISDNLPNGPLIPAGDVDAATNALGISKADLMLRLLPQAAAYARVPISGFHVGAIAEGLSGALYFGTNIEFEGLPLSASIHGEQCAINHALLSGETGLRSIAVNAAPCGYCRQFMNELSTAESLLIRLQDQPAAPLASFLPSAFGPADLGIEDRLMRPSDHALSSDRPAPLFARARDAANSSYAPYSGNASGVALELRDGRIIEGRYSENAAYNPSMSPMQSAIAHMTMKSEPGERPEIAAAALVERRTHVSQKDVTEQVLASVAPGVALGYLAVT